MNSGLLRDSWLLTCSSPIFSAAEHLSLPFSVMERKMLRLGGALKISLLAFTFPRNLMWLNEEKRLSGNRTMQKLLITIGNGRKGPEKPVCREIQPKSDAIAMSPTGVQSQGYSGASVHPSWGMVSCCSLHQHVGAGQLQGSPGLLSSLPLSLHSLSCDPDACGSRCRQRGPD